MCDLLRPKQDLEASYDYSMSDDVKQEQSRRATEAHNKTWDKIMKQVLGDITC